MLATRSYQRIEKSSRLSIKFFKVTNSMNKVFSRYHNKSRVRHFVSRGQIPSLRCVLHFNSLLCFPFLTLFPFLSSYNFPSISSFLRKSAVQALYIQSGSYRPITAELQ